MAKGKIAQVVKQAAVKQVNRRQLEQARRDHAKGVIAREDYIWAAMQCYAAEIRSARH